MKTVRQVIASNDVPSLQMRSVGSQSRSGREKAEKKELTGVGSLSMSLVTIKMTTNPWKSMLYMPEIVIITHFENHGVSRNVEFVYKLI